MKIKDLSFKQLIGVLGYYNNIPERDKMSFTEFVEKCEKGDPDHENQVIYYLKESNELGKKWVMIDHGFYNLYESEEKEIDDYMKELFNRFNEKERINKILEKEQ